MTDAVPVGERPTTPPRSPRRSALGFAERDPTADVEGFDAGAKAAIIATVAFGAKVVAGDVYHEGISRITGSEIAIAHRLGYVVKLLGIVERDADRRHQCPGPPGDGADQGASAGVGARQLQRRVRRGEFVDSLMFYGRGAGGAPTASAVFGDVVDAAINLRNGTHGSLGELEAARSERSTRPRRSTCSASTSPTSRGAPRRHRCVRRTA
jgi:homoserine dehydrogenase